VHDFSQPDWTAAIDLSALLVAIPIDSTVMGLFFQTALAEAKAKGEVAGRGEYSSLTKYPTTELAQVLYQSATLAYPDVPVREALRRIGQKVFPKIRETTAGALLFSVAGNRPFAAVKLIGRAYKLFTSSVSATPAEQADGSILVEMRNLWTFADSYHLGIIEGAFISYGSKSEILVRRHSICDVDFLVKSS